MADNSGFGGMSPLGMLYGSQGAQAGMMGLGIDPSLYALQPEMQAAQSGMQTGISTAPVYSPLGGLARAAQAFLGKNMMTDIMGKYTASQGQEAGQQEDAIKRALGPASPGWEYYQSLSPSEKWNFRTKYFNEIIQNQSTAQTEIGKTMQDRDRMLRSGTGTQADLDAYDSKIIQYAQDHGLGYGYDQNHHPYIFNMPGGIQATQAQEAGTQQVESQYKIIENVKYWDDAKQNWTTGPRSVAWILAHQGYTQLTPDQQSQVSGQGGGQGGGGSSPPPPRKVGGVDAQGNVNAQ